MDPIQVLLFANSFLEGKSSQDFMKGYLRQNIKDLKIVSDILTDQT